MARHNVGSRSARSRARSLGMLAGVAVVAYLGLITYVLFRAAPHDIPEAGEEEEEASVVARPEVVGGGAYQHSEEGAMPAVDSGIISLQRENVVGGEDMSMVVQLGHQAQATETGRVPGCSDSTSSCKSWADAGECFRNPRFMVTGCRDSCGLCEAPVVQRVIPLADGRASMPAVGFGTAGLGAGTRDAVAAAFGVGYRHFDSAQAREWYREDLLGQALAEPLAQQRESLFITSKMHPRHLGYNTTLAQVRQTLSDLDTAYLDLFMLHFPQCWGTLCDGKAPEGTWQDSWRALEALHRQGVVRAIGVSNFDMDQLVELVGLASEGAGPHVVQANSDPFHPNTEMQDFCRLQGIQFVGYSSLGSQWMMRGYTSNPVLANHKVGEVAAAHGVAPAQAVLRWALQKGQVVIPRSSKRERMVQNLDLWAFQLSDADVQLIDSLAGLTP